MAQDYNAGMKNNSPEACDASTKLPKGPSVNEPTRSSTAPSPPTLGPRTA